MKTIHGMLSNQMLEKIQYKMEDAMSDGIFTFMEPTLDTMVYRIFNKGISDWHLSMWMQIVKDTKPKKT
jgi:hypothetical protein